MILPMFKPLSYCQHFAEPLAPHRTLEDRAIACRMEVAMKRCIKLWSKDNAAEVEMTAAKSYAFLLRVLRCSRSDFISKLCCKGRHGILVGRLSNLLRAVRVLPNDNRVKVEAEC